MKKKVDFNRVFKEGNAVKGNFLFIRSKTNDNNTPRFGFIIPAKIVNGAVARNRLKRSFSETARKYTKEIGGGKDIAVIVTRKGAEEAMNAEFVRLLNQKQ